MTEPNQPLVQPEPSADTQSDLEEEQAVTNPEVPQEPES